MPEYYCIGDVNTLWCALRGCICFMLSPIQVPRLNPPNITATSGSRLHDLNVIPLYHLEFCIHFLCAADIHSNCFMILYKQNRRSYHTISAESNTFLCRRSRYFDTHWYVGELTDNARSVSESAVPC